jgi:signal peptidase I
MIELMDPTLQDKQTPPTPASQAAPNPVSPAPSPIASPPTPPPEPSPASAPQQQSALSSIWQRIEGFLSFALFVGGIVVAAVLINQFIFQAYYVDGTSMTPTLRNNDRLIIDKLDKTLSAIQGKPYIPSRGQIVVLDSSILDQNGNNEQLIKRVIGLPGDTVNIKNGIVTIKDSLHPDGFNADTTLGLKLSPTYSTTPIELTVPRDKIFVMGDNRTPNGSYDSRSFGPIDGSKIQGRLIMRIFPFDSGRLF